ncbi:hypothetical protein T492DRAFT_962952 [Pavlovales sp. CCMP2436]|nr:hypothetical protein T492DRAFT_962952 [Pavlovales sp. CCMP2436]
MLLRQGRSAARAVHFSKHSDCQGFIKHVAQLLLSGLITKEDYLALCDHDTLAVNMIRYVLGSRVSCLCAPGQPIRFAPASYPIPHYRVNVCSPRRTLILSVQRAMVGQFTAMRQEQALQMATFAQVMVSVLSTSLMGLAQSGAPVPAEQLHAVAASLNAVGNTLVASCAQLNATVDALIGGGSGPSTIQQAMMRNHAGAPPVISTCPHLEGAPFVGVLPQVLPTARGMAAVGSTFELNQQQQQPWSLPQPQPQQVIATP